LAAKRFLLEAKLARMFTVQPLQALLLVTFNELGHGIYRLAYMSVGACARYGLALGIDRQTSSNQTTSLLHYWNKKKEEGSGGHV